MLKKLPFSVSGVALGLAGLGNLLGAGYPLTRVLCGGASMILLILFLLKCIAYPKAFGQNMGDPVSAGVTGTFNMAWMLLCGYLHPCAPNLAEVIWYLAIGLQLALMGYYTVRFLAGMKLEDCYPVLFVVYAGSGVASVTAPLFGTPGIALLCLGLSFARYLVFLGILLIRYIRIPEVPEENRPMFCILAAPASLCLVGYLQSAPRIAAGVVIGMLILSTAVYWVVLWNLPRLLRIPFYPSYAAFTFPFVIKATSMVKASEWLLQAGYPVGVLQWAAKIETVIAAGMVAYTVLRYLLYMVRGAEAP